MVLQARIDLRGGRDDMVMAGIREYLSHNAIDLDLRQEFMEDPTRLTRLRITRAEVLGLLAAAAHGQGDRDLPLLVRMATLAGADMRALRSGD